ncbi:Hypothetical_protein [Hexamita inflata]|uniref:Hypothetical_protein n=1 Tax=Hexamita inflata TaxID=28002 RepID=A0AA86V352_9EUKA|nr:Hypothetical protein HINF_LOCUS62041 [Hexamita inflata]
MVLMNLWVAWEKHSETHCFEFELEAFTTKKTGHSPVQTRGWTSARTEQFWEAHRETQWLSASAYGIAEGQEAEQFLTSSKYFLSAGQTKRQLWPSMKFRVWKSAQEFSHLEQVAWQDSTPVKLAESQAAGVQNRNWSALTLQQEPKAQVETQAFEPSFKNLREAWPQHWATQTFPVMKQGFAPSHWSWQRLSFVNLVVLNIEQATSHLSIVASQVTSRPCWLELQSGRQVKNWVDESRLQNGAGQTATHSDVMVSMNLWVVWEKHSETHCFEFELEAFTTKKTGQTPVQILGWMSARTEQF